MKLRIHTSDISGQEELRTLLLDAIEQLAGSGCKILESKLPWDGHPILLVDAELHPVLISFDPQQNLSALLNGLQATEQLTTALPWVNQVYDDLQKQQRPPRLVVVSSEPPPGATAILSTCASLSIFQYKVLNINGETGLWLDRVGALARTQQIHEPAPAPVPQPAVVADETTPESESMPDLSEEERSYFQQL